MQYLEQISYWCILYSTVYHSMFFETFLLYDYYYLILLNKLYSKEHLLLTGFISYWWMSIASSRENKGKMVESLKYFVTYCLWKPFFDSNLFQTPSNLISLTILVTLRLLTLFQSKVRAIKLPKRAEICLTWQLLFRSFHWGRNLVLKPLQVCFRTLFKKIK